MTAFPQTQQPVDENQKKKQKTELEDELYLYIIAMFK